MTNNEEPMKATEPAGANDDELQLIDLDDVEGHGMREVAAGLGAAAVLAGAGTAAAATIGVHPSLPHHGSQMPSISNPVQTADRATDNAIETARDLRDGAITSSIDAANAATGLAGNEVRATGATATNVLVGADRTAATVLDASGQLVRDDAKAAGKVAGGATATTVTVARATVTTTNAVTAGTEKTATTTASSSLSTAASKIATTVTLTTNTVNALETTIVASVQELNPDAGAGASGMGSNGWVTFSVGGQNIASVQIHDGSASVTVKTASLPGKVLQAAYSGDATHAASLHSITL